MKLKRTSLLVEPPASATSDIAFILIVFFLVCASVEPDKGRAQTLPRSEPEKEKEKQSQTLEVELTRNAVIFNRDPMSPERFTETIKLKLADKTRDEDKIVAVKSRKEVPYSHWMMVTDIIEKAGGVITLQLEETQKIQVK
ncbi:MAG: biopolymer transporter ExbD [Verrucomicrobiales bacterium]|nr:biopolymer transporter ExbD [Verrucomicrobiales bacterium]HCU87143.1 biopolymer transporter ExbD [Verrucomicrobiales bacterium]